MLIDRDGHWPMPRLTFDIRHFPSHHFTKHLLAMVARATFKDKEPLKTLARASKSCAKEVSLGEARQVRSCGNRRPRQAAHLCENKSTIMV